MKKTSLIGFLVLGASAVVSAFSPNNFAGGTLTPIGTNEISCTGAASAQCNQDESSVNTPSTKAVGQELTDYTPSSRTGTTNAG